VPLRNRQSGRRSHRDAGTGAGAGGAGGRGGGLGGLGGAAGRGDPGGPAGSAAWLIGGILLAIGALLAGGAWLYMKSNELRVVADERTLCRVDGQMPEATVVLLDLSSTLSSVQQLDVKNELTRLRDTVPRFGRLEIFAVDDRAARLIEPVLALCNPGRGDDMNAIYQNPQLARQRWERDFASTLDAAIEELLHAPESATSPIFEAIQAVALQTFDDPQLDDVQARRLVLVSDLMQNVPGQLRMYDGIPKFDEFARSPYWLDVKTELDGVDVTVLYLQRPASQRWWQAQVEFWSRYFEAQGASIERVLPLSGAQ
jgi:hypothetical protein